MNVSKKNRKLKSVNSLSYRRRVAYGFLLPNIIGFLLFSLFPICAAVVYAFLKWDNFTTEFAGLANFKTMLRMSDFWISLKNTILYAAGVVPATTLIALILALIMSRKILVFKTGFRLIFFFPNISSIMANLAIWRLMYHPDQGIFTVALRAIGIANPPAWLASPDWALPSIIIMQVWATAGYFMVILIAGLESIPQTLNEAAVIDGANAWQKFYKITLPMISPAMFFVVLMETIWAFQLFTQIYCLTQGGPGRATYVLPYLVYRDAFEGFNFGLASAEALVLFAIVFTISIIQFRLQRKLVVYE